LKPKEKKLLIILFCVAAYLSFPFAVKIFTSDRKLYDSIMLWVNFGVLVVVFIKFARKPLMDALHSVREKIKKNLDAIKKQFDDTKSDVDGEQAKLDNIEQYLEEVQKHIIEMGKKERARIIEQARITAEKMIADAEAHAAYQMAKAKKELSDEMVDIAISMVEKKLKKEITQEDNASFVDQFLVNLETTKPQLN
jgi:F-type H+-transporting ATPase subunit b